MHSHFKEAINECFETSMPDQTRQAINLLSKTQESFEKVYPNLHPDTYTNHNKKFQSIMEKKVIAKCNKKEQSQQQNEAFELKQKINARKKELRKQANLSPFGTRQVPLKL